MGPFPYGPFFVIILDMFKTAIKAFVVGASMMIPGVSGGSMAMILGIYDRLIDSVPNLFCREKMKESLLFLLVFLAFACLGILLVAKPLEILIARYSLTLMYFFLGAVVGTIPMMLKKAQSQGFDLVGLIYIIIGAGLVFSIDFLPEGVFSPSLNGGLSSIIIQVLGGVLVSVGLVLPGISTSYLLLVLGLYEPVIGAISSGDFLSLLPLGIGGIIGILALTKGLQVAMRDYPKITFMMILGFLLASIREIYPGLPSGILIVVSIILFLLGFFIVYRLSKLED